jgi:spore maturation protein SpmA
MVLNYIWLGFFVIAFIVALCKLVFLGDTEVFSTIINGSFTSAKNAFEISIGLTGMMAFWMGIMKIAEEAGAIRVLSKLVAPFFTRVFPGIPKDHPASGHILMNFSANMLGLGNAATPLGLKAMNSMQELNKEKDTASNSQIMFLVLNTAGLTLIPVSVMVYRTEQHAANPSDVFIPILLATFAGTLAGFLSVAIYQKINLLDRLLLSCVIGFSLLVGTLTWFFTTMPQEQVAKISTIAGNLIIFTIIVLFLAGGFIKRINVYETFIEGAKDGFNIAIKVIPYLVAILVGIGVFRASGAMDFIVGAIGLGVAAIGLNTDFVPALPTAFMKSLSGSGANGLMVDAMAFYGPDSFVGRLVCTMQGATDTTFYILAVYFGSVGIKKTRYALTCGLIADLFGMIAAIFICYLFFH